MATFLRRFFAQPARRYRDFQIAFTILTLNFAIPAASYVVAPEVAVSQFSKIGALLGGGPYAHAPGEASSRLWRYLGAANVMTLAFMCLLLQLDLRRNYRVLLPLLFLKGFNATLFVGGFATTRYPAFLVVAFVDFLTTGAFAFFAVRARRDIEARSDGDLVPRPRGR